MDTLELFETFGKFFYDIATQEQVDELEFELNQAAMAKQREEILICNTLASVL